MRGCSSAIDHTIGKCFSVLRRRAVLTHTSNPGILLEMVHAELFARTDLTRAGQMNFFDPILETICVTRRSSVHLEADGGRR
jgi:hypothetical protein